MSGYSAEELKRANDALDSLGTDTTPQNTQSRSSEDRTPERYLDELGIDDPDIRNSALALADIESSGGRNTTGPEVKGGSFKGQRARGIWQAMEGNIRARGGDPENEDDANRIGLEMYLESLKKTGDPVRAAGRHHAGDGGLARLDRGDIPVDQGTGLDTLSYMDKFKQRLDSRSGQNAQTGASGSYDLKSFVAHQKELREAIKSGREEPGDGWGLVGRERFIDVGGDKQPAPEETMFGAAKKGFSTVMPQTKQAVGAGLAYIGDEFDSDGAKSMGRSLYETGKKEGEKFQTENADIKNVILGDGNVKNYIGYWAGYGLGQVAETAVVATTTALIGGAVGSVVPGAGTAAAGVAGVVTGLLGKTGAKAAILAAGEKAFAKAGLVAGATEATKIAAKEQAIFAATKSYGTKALMALTGTAGGYANNTALEMGEVYGHYIDKAKSEGREPTEAERDTAFWHSVGAASVETLADIAGIGQFLKSGKKVGKGLSGAVATVGKEGLVGLAREVPTEVVQTYIERRGKGQPTDNEEAMWEYANAAGGAAVMGGGSGTLAGGKAQLFGGKAQDAEVAAKAAALAAQPKPHSPLSNAAIAGSASSATSLASSANPSAAAPQDAGFGAYGSMPEGLHPDLLSSAQAIAEFMSVPANREAIRQYGKVHGRPDLAAEMDTDWRNLSARTEADGTVISPNPEVQKFQIDRLAGAISSLKNYNFSSGKADSVTPGTSVARPVQQGGGLAPVSPVDNAIEGEATTIAGELPGANRLLPAPPVLALDHPAAIEARRNAEANLAQQNSDLDKMIILDESDSRRVEKIKQVAEAEAALKEANARLADITKAIDGNRAIETAKKRNGVLGDVLSDPRNLYENHEARFKDALKKAGFTDSTPTAEELQRIEAFKESRDTESAEPIYSAPDESGLASQIKEKQPKVVQPSVRYKVRKGEGRAAIEASKLRRQGEASGIPDNANNAEVPATGDEAGRDLLRGSTGTGSRDTGGGSPGLRATSDTPTQDGGAPVVVGSSAPGKQAVSRGFQGKFYAQRQENGTYRAASNKNHNPISPAFKTAEEADAWAEAFIAGNENPESEPESKYTENGTPKPGDIVAFQFRGEEMIAEVTDETAAGIGSGPRMQIVSVISAPDMPMYRRALLETPWRHAEAPEGYRPLYEEPKPVKQEKSAPPEQPMESSGGGIHNIPMMATRERSIAQRLSQGQTPLEISRQGYSIEEINQVKAEGVEEVLKAEPVSAREQAMNKLGQGIDELISLVGGKMNMMPEEESRLIPIMSKIFRAAAELGYLTFEDAARFVMQQIRGKSKDTADKLDIGNLQAGYINTVKEFSSDPKADKLAALSFDSIDELMAKPDAERAAIAEAEAKTAVNPTEAQKKAGNYVKGKVRLYGQDISIETPRGAERSGVSKDGEKWSVTMPASYGYFLGSEGADGDHVDAFIGAHPESNQYWVVNQTKPDSTEFDEHKVLIGYRNEDEAQADYLLSFTDTFGYSVLGSVVGPFPVSGLADALPGMKSNAPLAGDVVYKSPRIANMRKPLNAVSEREWPFPGTAPEHANNVGKALDESVIYRPTADGKPVTTNDGAIPEGIVPLEMSEKDFKEVTDEWAELFADPDKKVRLADKTKAEGYLPIDEAAARVAEWKEHARKQGEEHGADNSSKTVLSLFDLSGEWSKPWKDAGYNVITMDIQTGQDVHDFSVEYFTENYDLTDVYAILAACPCTDFASSGARHFEGKDADGRTEASKELVFQTMRTIEYFRPAIWALENPVGRIERLTGLPKARLTFDPNDLGDPYTKKTMLWGKFNADMPIAPVEPTEGSKMHSQYGGKSQATKNARSVTPEGFAYSFFMANNYIDMPVEQKLTTEYPEVSGAIKAALNAGVTEARIHELMDDTYGNYEYDDARAALVKEVGKVIKSRKRGKADGNETAQAKQGESQAPQQSAARQLSAEFDRDKIDFLSQPKKRNAFIKKLRALALDTEDGTTDALILDGLATKLDLTSKGGIPETLVFSPPAKEITVRAPAKHDTETLRGALMSLGGLNISLRDDTAHKDVGSAGGLFSADGRITDLSEAAEYLIDQGFHEIERTSDSTGQSHGNALADMIGRVAGGERIYTDERGIREHEAELAREHLQNVLRSAEALGLKGVGGKRTLAVVEAEIDVEVAQRAAFGEQLRQATEEFDAVAEAELIARFDLAILEHKDETRFARNEETAENFRRSAEALAQENGDELDTPAQIEGGAGFNLDGQTNESAVAEAKRLTDLEAQRLAEERKASESERNAAEAKEIQSRQGIGADNFELSAQVNDQSKQKKADAKSADDQLAGQGSLFDDAPVTNKINPLSPGGYAQIAADPGLQEDYQDILDSAFGERIIDIRNALRDLGWEGENGGVLANGNRSAKFDIKYVGAGRNVVGVAVNGITDDFSKTPSEIAAAVNAQSADVIIAKAGDSLVDENGEDQWLVDESIRDYSDDSVPVQVTINVNKLSERKKSVTLGQLKARIADDKAFRDSVKMPAESAGARAKDDEGQIIYKEGERVEYVSGSYEGRHGEISEVNPHSTTKYYIYGGGPTTVTKSYSYQVKTDNGATFYASAHELKVEGTRPESVTPDPVLNGYPIDPNYLLRSIQVDRQQADSSRAAAQRAKKAEKIAEHKADAVKRDAKADAQQAVWDAWVKANPGAIEGLEPDSKDIAALHAAKPESSSVNAGTDAAGTLKAAGIYVTKTKTNKDKDVWEVSGNTKSNSDLLKRLGGRWYGPKKVWSYYNADPSESIAAKLSPVAPVVIAPTPVLADNDVQLPGNPYIYRREPNGVWTWRVGAVDSARANPLPANSPIIVELTAALSAKNPTIGNKPVIEMPDRALEQIKESETPAGEKARAELEEREAADEDDLGSMFDDVLAEELAKDAEKAAPVASKPRKPVTPQVANPHTTPLGMKPVSAAEAEADARKKADEAEKRNARAAAKSAAVNTAKGLQNAIAGLGKLFGSNGSRLSSGLSYDEKSYAAAKPLFAQAVKHFIDAGADIKEAMRAVIRMVLDQFGAQAADNMKPYVVKFMQDVKSGNVVYDEEQEVVDDDPRIEAQGGGALDGVAPEEVGGAGQGGSGRRGTESGSDSGGARDSSVDGQGGETGRGGRNSPAGTDPTEAGKGSVAGSRDGRSRKGSKTPEDRNEGLKFAAEEKAEEVHAPLADFNIGEDVALGSGGQMEKYRDNLAAIKLIKQLEAEKRRATPDEQRTLARYVGWGGIPNAFPNPQTGEIKADWAKEVAEVQALLTPKEHRAASASTPNAHYTSQTVVNFMWRAAARLGFNGGLVLEPSVGTGNFIGLMPEHLRATTHITGIELDSLTSRIAGALYPRSNIIQSGFDKLPMPEDHFDMAIGNPPFGDIKLRFKYNPELNGSSIHNQFFRSSMNAVRPGGLQVMIVTASLMDAKGKHDRMELSKEAKLLGAIRLPGMAFKGNALTEVVTDILFLQKRTAMETGQISQAMHERGKKIPANEDSGARAARIKREMLLAEAESWVETGSVKDPSGNEPIEVNQYFIDNPHMIAGVMDRTGSMWRANAKDVKLREGETLEQALDNAMQFLPNGVREFRSDEVNERTLDAHKKLGESLALYATGAEEGAIRFEPDGTLTQVIERVGLNGELALTKITITPKTPWSHQLSMNLEGKWFRTVPKLDANGNTVKQMKDNKPTKLNVYEREIFNSEADVPSGLLLGEKSFAIVKQLIEIRNLYVEQLNLETNSASIEAMEGNRTKLREAYEAFVKEHGFISEPKNAGVVSDMPDEGLLLSLEQKYKREVTAAKAKRTGMKASPATAEQSAILTRPVGIPPARNEHADTIGDALAMVLSEMGRLDIPRLKELRGISEDEVKAELTAGEQPLAYADPERGNALVDKNEYLSGNVRRKLEAARNAGLEANIVALDAVQPEAWTSDKVAPKVGSTWIPAQVFADFANFLLGTDTARVTFAKLTNTFNVIAQKDGAEATTKWGTARMPAPEILQNMLNSRKVAVYDSADRDGGPYFNQEETDKAQDKQKEILEAFDSWIFQDSERRQILTQLFNDEFNVRVNRQHDGSHMKFPGKVPDEIISLRRGQINAIWRGVVENFVLYDHAVGAGKTFTGIARAMERRRMGLSKKPMIVVPNHLVKEWQIQTYRLYPGAKVLAATKKDLEPRNRRRLFAKIAAGDWDVVIVPHSSFGMISLSQETEDRFLESQLQLAATALKAAQQEDDGDRFKSPGVKAAEALIKKIETRMDAARSKKRDKLVTFEQMGVDDLTVDESHEFKNLQYSSTLEGVRGMGNPTGSNKALDMYMKIKLLHENKGSVAFMTGTPISNSAVEIYSIMRYLAPDLLNEMELEHFDAFRTMFVDATTAFEPTDSGGSIKEVTRLGRPWSNMRALMDAYYTVADVVTNDDIKQWYAEDNPGKEFPLPKVKGGERQAISVDPTPTQLRVLLETIADFDSLPFIDDIKERNAERLRLMDRARKVSLHAKAVDPTLDDEKGGKLDKAVDEITRIYRQWDADKGTQLVFLDRGVPKSKGDSAIIKAYDAAIAERDAAELAGDQDAFGRANDKLENYDANEIAELRMAQTSNWSGYQHIKDGLIAQGIPANEIAFIQDYNSDADKEALFGAVRDGSIRVLIGSTPRMGAGTNVQERLVALHHIDATWKPSDIEQREGRIIRQGNLLYEKYMALGIPFEVEINAYVTERTVDAKLWALNSMKLTMINAIRYYDGSFEMDFEDSDAGNMAELAAIASGDPLMLERVQLISEVDKLYRLSRSFNRRIEAAQGSIIAAERIIDRGPAEIKRLTEIGKAVEALNESERKLISQRKMTLMGKSYSDVKEAQWELSQEINRQKNGDDKAPVEIDINGRTFKSKSAAEDEVARVLGDADPFRAEINGKTLTQRSEYARELIKILGNEFEEGKELDVGVIYGIPVKVYTSIGRMFQSNHVELQGRIPVNERGGTVSIDFTVDVKPEKHKEGTSVTITVMALRPLISGFINNIAHAGRVNYEIGKIQKAIIDAEKDLPVFEEATKETFKRGDEYQQKKARLDEVEDILEGREKAAAAKALTQPGWYFVTNEKGERESAPRELTAEAITEITGSGGTVQRTAAPKPKKPLPAGALFKYDRYGNLAYVGGAKSVVLDGLPDSKFFVHKVLPGASSYNKWEVSELSTGMRIIGAKTQSGAIEDANAEVTKRGAEFIAERIANAEKIPEALKQQVWDGRGGAPMESRAEADFSEEDGLPDDVQAKITGATQQTIRSSFVKAFGDKSIRQLEANGRIRIMASVEAFKALMPGVAVSPTAKAIFVGDQAFFFADRMNPATAHQELLHEVGEHYGLARMLGADGYDSLIAAVKALRASGDLHASKAWEFVARNYPEEVEGSKRFMHEVIAQIGQNADIQAKPFWKEMIAAVKRFLIKMGFTGMIKTSDVQDMVMHSLKMAAKPEGGGPRGGIRESQVPSAASKSGNWYYSALSTTIPGMSKVADKAGMILPSQAKAWLQARQKEGKFKQDELVWSGLLDYLDMQQGKVSVDDIQAFVRENGVQVKDVVLSDVDYRLERRREFNDDGTQRFDVYDADGNFVDSFDNMRDADYLVEREGKTETKFSQYVLPGGENYRELLITLPHKAGRVINADVVDRGRDTDGRAMFDVVYGDEVLDTFSTWSEASDYADGVAEYNGTVSAGLGEKAPFRTAHFPDQTNILAHVRMNERTDSTGAKVLFIEEIQSDWGQQGKKEGFTSEQSSEVKALVAERDRRIAARDTDDLWKINARLQELGYKPTTVGTVGVPNAPFITDDSYMNLAMKRAIVYAVDNGFDRIAWTSGQQQFERFPKGHDGQSTEKGMKTAYDIKLPSIARKLGAEVGVVDFGDEDAESKYVLDAPDVSAAGDFQQEVIVRDRNTLDGVHEPFDTLDAAEEWLDANDMMVGAMTQPGFTITDKMREQAAGGFPLFSKGSIWARARELFQKYAESDSLFKYPRTTETEFKDAVADFRGVLGATITSDETAGTSIIDDEGSRKYIEKAFRKIGLRVQIIEDGKLVGVRPVEITVNYLNRTVELNVIALKEATVGSAIYNVVGQWAHNNKLTFIGDTSGVSNKAMYRRLENIISLALKVGSTQYMRLHPDQLRKWSGRRSDDPNFYWPGVEWTNNSDTNLENMLEASYDVIKHHVPEIENVTFDASAGEFRYGSAGRVYTEEDFEELAGKPGARRASAGRTTLERAALARSVVEAGASASKRSELTGEPTEQQVQSTVPPNRLRKSFYSKGNYLDELKATGKEYAAAFNGPTAKTFNVWWHKTVGTMYHLSTVNKPFKRVFDSVQDFIRDTSKIAKKSEALAPDLIPQGFLSTPIRAEDTRAIAAPISLGTLHDHKLTDDELRKGSFLHVPKQGDLLIPETVRFEPLNEKQIEYFHQYQDAINQSVDDLARAELQRLFRTSGVPSAVIDLAFSDTETTEEFLDTVLGAMRDRQMSLDIEGEGLGEAWVKEAKAVSARAEKLKADGYSPLMRFGKYSLYFYQTQIGKDGLEKKIPIYFTLFESETERNLAEPEIRKSLEMEYEDVVSEIGIVSEERSSLLEGMTPEMARGFANAMGIEQDEAFQEYLKMSTNNRSVLKRLIHRKGTAGYSEDIPRVLASFIVGNARRASSISHITEAQKAANAISRSQGDVKDMAEKLIDNVSNPKEEAGALRGFMFFNFLGGSVASALVNLTQTVIQTAPYLYQFVRDGNIGRTGLAKELMNAQILAGQIIGSTNFNTKEPEMSAILRRALDRADKEGETVPHEIHQLMAEARGNSLGRSVGKTAARLVGKDEQVWGANAEWGMQRFMRGWGAMFGLAEESNRLTAFIAAHNIATAKGMSEEKAYAFAAKAITETQSVYNKGNRPVWARGAVGATVFTFKQFTIQYLEFLRRLYKNDKEAFFVAVGVLVMVAGISGLPGSDDLDDILDTIGQWMGFATNTKKERRQLVENTVGKVFGQVGTDFVMNGVSAFLPVDIHARLGVGNIIPGTGMLNPSKTADQRLKQALEIVGPVGGLLNNSFTSMEKASKGDIDGAFVGMMPSAIKNVVAGGKMASNGYAEDGKGRRVTDTDMLDAVMKSIGLQPSSVASVYSHRAEHDTDKAIYNNMRAGISARWAEGMAHGDADKTAEALRDLREWNLSHPDMVITIQPKNIVRRANEIRSDTKTRYNKAAPKALRAAFEEEDMGEVTE